MTRILAYLAMLVLLALLAWWLLQPDPAPAPTMQTETDEQPDQFMENIHLRHMDETGQLLFELRARKMSHFPDDGRATLDDIMLDYYSTDHPPWLLEAREGRIPADRDHLHLSGDVRLEMRLDEDEPLTLLLTPALDVDLQTRLATSDSGVIISRAHSELRGQNMRADLDTGIIQLEHNVRGRHEPPARQQNAQ